MIEIREREKDFWYTIYHWLNQDKEYLKNFGIDYISEDTIKDFWNTSKLFEIIRNNKPIGFIKLDLISFCGIFHIYLISEERKKISNYFILKKFLKICFKEYHFRNIYTYYKEKLKSNIFQLEGEINNFYVYSVNKERCLYSQ